MALILKGIGRLYFYLNEDIIDERTRDWPLIGSPWPGIALLLCYLFTVLKWLPDYMKSRPAYDLRRLLSVYNALQIVFCVYVVYYSLRLGWLNHYSLLCHPVDYEDHSIEYAWKVCYGYFVIKLIDLLDTILVLACSVSTYKTLVFLKLAYSKLVGRQIEINKFEKLIHMICYIAWAICPSRNFMSLPIFFVLRKKQNQVTFLHVYHHFGMVAVAWGIVKWLPGGHITMLVPINSSVHIIMYGYYFLTTWDDHFKKSLWWKKHVTQVQIIQFSILLVHFLALALASDCPVPRAPAYILIPQNLFMVILFSDFYYRSYIKPNKTTKTN